LVASIVSTKAKWTPSKRLGVGDRRKRRRSWPTAEKRRIVAETLVPGASVSVVARRHDVNANQVFKWRRELAAAGRVALPGPACEFVPIGVFADVEGKVGAAAQGDDGRPDAPAPRSGLMDIELGAGVCVRVDASVDERALGRVLRALRQAG
jgi:transposase